VTPLPESIRNSESRPGVFLDRDGVLIENVHTYVREWSHVEIFPFVPNCLARLKALGLPVFVVTNQAIVGRGLLPLDQITALHARIIEAIDPQHAILQSYLCPHHPDERCNCRKPLPGSLLKASREFNIDLEKSFMIGDAITDIEAGLNAKVQPILVLTGRGMIESQKFSHLEIPVLPSLSEAVDWIEKAITIRIMETVKL